MAKTYPKILLNSLVARLPYRSDSPDIIGIYTGWLEDPAQMVATLGIPEAGEAVVHLDKSKWFGPGNVKVLPRRMAHKLRRDAVNLRDYYSRRPFVYGEPIHKQHTR